MFIWYELFLDNNNELRVTALKSDHTFYNSQLARLLRKDELSEIARKSGTVLDGNFTVTDLVEILTEIVERVEEDSDDGG